MKRTKVLLIDDDAKLGTLLKDYLAQYSMELENRTSPSEGKKFLSRFKPDLVILDVMMPEQDGLSLCKEIRSNEPNLPIIMLTARVDTVDRVVGLELGADDYVPKPFEPRELVARIQSVLRRTAHLTDDRRTRFGELEIRLDEKNAFLKGLSLDLTTTEFEFIRLLSSRPGKKFTRDEIMNHLSGVDADVFSRSIDILVSRVRNKLGDNSKTPKFIKTAWGTGYLFIGKTT